MTLLYRIKRLVKADAHAVVEGLEEPKWILAQAIRDMEEELEKRSHALSDKKSNQEQIEKQIKKINEVLQSAEHDIQLAMDEKREDIAKSLIKKQIISRKNLQSYKEQREQLQKAIEMLEKDFVQKKQSYDEVCAQSQTLKFTKANDVVFDGAQDLVSHENDLEHQVELEFLRRLKGTKGDKHEN